MANIFRRQPTGRLTANDLLNHWPNDAEQAIANEFFESGAQTLQVTHTADAYVTFPTHNTATEIMVDDAGELSQFYTAVGTVSASSVFAHCGGYAIRIQATGTAVSHLQLTQNNISLSDGQSTTLSFAFLPAAMPVVSEQFWAHESGIYLRLNADGSVTGVGGSTPAGTIKLNQWNWVSIKFRCTITDFEFSDGYIDFWTTINGTEYAGICPQYPFTSGAGGVVRIGKRTNTNGGDVDYFYDDILWTPGSTYPLPESVVAIRTATTGVPKYNNFPRSTQDIGNTWGDLPYNNATTAFTSTAGDIQTAKIAPFSPQFSSNDTLLGAKIGGAGKISSGTNAVAAVKYIVDRVDQPDKVFSFTGSDSVKWTATFNPDSVAQLNVAEIGYSKTSVTASTHQVHDMYMVAAFTPAARTGTSVTDGFDYPGPLGMGWRQILHYPYTFQVVGGKASLLLGAGGEGTAVRTETYTNDQWAEGDINTTLPQVGVCTRVTGDTWTNQVGYFLVNDSATLMSLYKVSAGGGYSLLGSWAVSSGTHKIKLVSTGSSHACYSDGSLLGTANDSSYSSGAPAIYINSNGTTSGTVDNFATDVGQSSSTVDLTYTANAAVQTDVSATYTANVLVQVDNSLTYTANAYVDIPASTVDLTYTANALVQVDNSLTYTADADVLVAAVDKTYTANAVVQVDNSITYTANADVSVAAVDKTYAADALVQVDNSLTYTANADVSVAAVDKTYTANAVVQPDLSLTYTANAVVQVDNSLTYTANAVVQPDLSLTYTANAHVAVAGDVDLTYTANADVSVAAVDKTYTGNAVVQVDNQLTYTANTVVQPDLSATYTANALVQVDNSLTYTANALVQVDNSLTYTANADVSVAAVDKTYTVNALVQVDNSLTYTANADVSVSAVDKTFTANAMVQVDNSLTYTANAVVQPDMSLTYTADMWVVAPSIGNVSYTADADVLVSAVDKTYTANALVQVDNSLTYTANCVVELTPSISYTANTVVENTFTVSHTANAVVQPDLSKTYTGNAIVQADSTVSYAANAVVETAPTLSYTANAVLEITPTISYTANALVGVDYQVTHTANAVVAIESEISYQANADVQAESEASYQANAHVLVVVLEGNVSYDANASVLAELSSSHYADAFVLDPNPPAFQSLPQVFTWWCLMYPDWKFWETSEGCLCLQFANNGHGLPLQVFIFEDQLERFSLTVDTMEFRAAGSSYSCSGTTGFSLRF